MADVGPSRGSIRRIPDSSSAYSCNSSDNAQGPARKTGRVWRPHAARMSKSRVQGWWRHSSDRHSSETCPCTGATIKESNRFPSCAHIPVPHHACTKPPMHALLLTRCTVSICTSSSLPLMHSRICCIWPGANARPFLFVRLPELPPPLPRLQQAAIPCFWSPGLPPRPASPSTCVTGRNSLLPVADAPFLPDTPTMAAAEAAAAASPFDSAASPTTHAPASAPLRRHGESAATAAASSELPQAPLFHQPVQRVNTTAPVVSAFAVAGAVGGSPSPRALPQPSRLTHGLAAGSRLGPQVGATPPMGPSYSPPRTKGSLTASAAAAAGIGFFPDSPIHPGMFAPAFLASSAPQSPVGPEGGGSLFSSSPGRRTAGISSLSPGGKGGGGGGGGTTGPGDVPGLGYKGKGSGNGPFPLCGGGTDLPMGHLGRLNCSAAPMLSTSPSRRRHSR